MAGPCYPTQILVLGGHLQTEFCVSIYYKLGNPFVGRSNQNTQLCPTLFGSLTTETPPKMWLSDTHPKLNMNLQLILSATFCCAIPPPRVLSICKKLLYVYFSG